MNNEKIGKFIAKLRKAKNLTQQQLGDLVGVGGKSVSKWERGINMPDISIINEVSKILGITSDELLNGEFDRKSTNEEYKKKRSKNRKIVLLFTLIILAVSLTTILFLNFRNNTHKYWLTNNDDNYGIEGYIEYDKIEYTINIEKINCNLEECQALKIKNLQYSVSINGFIIYLNKNDDYIKDDLSINHYLYDNKVTIHDKFANSIITYEDFNNLKSASVIIEGYDINENLFKYEISLKITDKKQ